MTNLAFLGSVLAESVAPSTSGPPTPFQTLGVIVFGALFVLSLAAMFSGRATWREGIGWGFTWLVAAITMILPEVTVWVARTLGIGRGADLVLYCSVVVMLVGFMMVYDRIRRLQREVTLLVRHLAIREATGVWGSKQSSPESPSGRPEKDFGGA